MSLKLPLSLLVSGVIGCVSPKVSQENMFIRKGGGHKIMYANSMDDLSKFFPAPDKSNLFDTIIFYGKYTDENRDALKIVEQIYHSQIGPIETAIYDKWEEILTEIDCGPYCFHEFADKYSTEFRNDGW